MLRDRRGHLYGTTPYGGSGGWGLVYELGENGKETVLHNFKRASQGTVPEAGLVQDEKGNLYGSTSEGGIEWGTLFRLKTKQADSPERRRSSGGARCQRQREEKWRRHKKSKVGEDQDSKQIMARKINLEKVMASLNSLCPKCGYSIPPNETQRVSFAEMRCPKCNAVFVPGTGEP